MFHFWEVLKIVFGIKGLKYIILFVYQNLYRFLSIDFIFSKNRFPEILLNLKN